MKKETFLINEKHEKITILVKQKRRIIFVKNNERDDDLEMLTIDEAAKLSGINADEIRKDLKILRDSGE